MAKNHLHIISFNVPFPANYGGVIDVFYKIKSLHQLGVKITLHTFHYGRAKRIELEKFCSQVYYYPRPTDFTRLVSSKPFIVKTRNAKALLQNLKKENYPILFEGLHTCFFLNHPDLAHRKKYIRMHNVEWQYYSHLAKVEKNFFKKIYFNLENIKLKSFEKKIKAADALIAISKGDQLYFEKKYPQINTHFIPAFHPNENVEIKKGRGDYILFHGDLSVKDNEEAAIFLLENIAQGVDYQWVIAGLNPTNRLKKEIEKHQNVNLKSNLSKNEIENLIKNAHVNILLSFHSAGMKLKLLNALFKGRFCVVNNEMVKNTNLKEYCYVGNQPNELIDILQKIIPQNFSQTEIQKRKEKLETSFSNQLSAQNILDIIFPLQKQ